MIWAAGVYCKTTSLLGALSCNCRKLQSPLSLQILFVPCLIFCYDIELKPTAGDGNYYAWRRMNSGISLSFDDSLTGKQFSSLNLGDRQQITGRNFDHVSG